jgi:hypothetical protein
LLPTNERVGTQKVRSMTRVAADACGFLSLIYVFDGPER